MEKLYIICIDDQREVLHSIARDLQLFSAFADIEECESAEEAKDLIGELDAEGKHIALLVCDHIMPGVRGVDFLTEVESNPYLKCVKKILLTGQATHGDTIEAINKAHIDAYIEKPWNAGKLQECCKRLLTEYLFDKGLDVEPYRAYLDPKVVLARMSGRE